MFDKFRKKVQHAASEVDTDALSAEEGSEEATEAIGQQQPIDPPAIPVSEDEWEEIDDSEKLELPSQEKEEEWEDWNEEDDYSLPTKPTRKEKKVLAKQAKRENIQRKANTKELKKRGGKDVDRLAGSKVDLHMMRTTTGRQLVEVKAAPAGGSGSTDEEGIVIDLGGGVVESGGRIIKQSAALDNLIEELEWIMLESDISSDAVSTVMGALRKNLIGQRLRKGADIAKVLEAGLKRALRSILEAGYWDFYESIQSFIGKGDTPHHVCRGKWNGENNHCCQNCTSSTGEGAFRIGRGWRHIQGRSH